MSDTLGSDFFPNHFSASTSRDLAYIGRRHRGCCTARTSQGGMAGAGTPAMSGTRRNPRMVHREARGGMAGAYTPASQTLQGLCAPGRLNNGGIHAHEHAVGGERESSEPVPSHSSAAAATPWLQHHRGGRCMAGASVPNPPFPSPLLSLDPPPSPLLLPLPSCPPFSSYHPVCEDDHPSVSPAACLLACWMLAGLFACLLVCTTLSVDVVTTAHSWW